MADQRLPQLHIFWKVKVFPYLFWLPPSLGIIQKVTFNLFPSNSSTEHSAPLPLHSVWFVYVWAGTIRALSPNCQISPLVIVMQRLRLHVSDIVWRLRQLDAVCSLLGPPAERWMKPDLTKEAKASGFNVFHWRHMKRSIIDRPD